MLLLVRCLVGVVVNICDIVPKYLHEPTPCVIVVVPLLSCYSYCMCFGRYWLHCHHLASGKLMVHCTAYAMVRYYPLPLLCVGGRVPMQLEIEGGKKWIFSLVCFFHFFLFFFVFYILFFFPLIFSFFSKDDYFGVV